MNNMRDNFEIANERTIKWSLNLFSDEDKLEIPSELSEYEVCSILRRDKETLQSLFRKIEGTNKKVLEKNGFIDVYLVFTNELDESVSCWLGTVYEEE